jgi:hypothetical protein
MVILVQKKQGLYIRINNMENIEGKIKFYIASVFCHYKLNNGDNYNYIHKEYDYDKWFEEFKWNAICDYEYGYDIAKKYPCGEFFNYDDVIFQNIITYINDYYQRVLGNDYILSDYSPVNVMRHYTYVYVNNNSNLFYSLCKPSNLY